MSDEDDLIAALGPVAAALWQLGVDFSIGGSVASTYHGAIRSTMDVDLICIPAASRREPLDGISRGDDRNACEGPDLQEIVVAADEHIDIRGLSQCEQLIIIGIAADAMRQRRRLNQFDELAELAEHMLD